MRTNRPRNHPPESTMPSGYDIEVPGQNTKIMGLAAALKFRASNEGIRLIECDPSNPGLFVVGDSYPVAISISVRADGYLVAVNQGKAGDGRGRRWRNLGKWKRLAKVVEAVKPWLA